MGIIGGTLTPSPNFTSPQNVIRVAINEFIRARTHIECADPLETDRNSSVAKASVFNADNLHPNQLGYKTIATWPANQALMARILAT